MRDDKTNESNKRKNGIPVRYFLLFNSFFAFIMVYANKVVLSVAIVAMVSDLPIPNNQLSNQLIKNESIVNKPEFAALRSAFDNHNLTNSSNQLINNQTSSVLKAINPTVIKHHHKNNQVYYDHPTRSKVLGWFCLID